MHLEFGAGLRGNITEPKDNAILILQRQKKYQILPGLIRRIKKVNN